MKVTGMILKLYEVSAYKTARNSKAITRMRKNSTKGNLKSKHSINGLPHHFFKAYSARSLPSTFFFFFTFYSLLLKASQNFHGHQQFFLFAKKIYINFNENTLKDLHQYRHRLKRYLSKAYTLYGKTLEHLSS